VQAQILDVLKTARDMTGAAVVLVTHDLGVVAGLADRVAIMYAGKVVELGNVDDVYEAPAMPYTIGLLRSIPRVDAVGSSRLTSIDGVPPSPVALLHRVARRPHRSVMKKFPTSCRCRPPA
jgi:peptide/nickel transport system ATP-binding protein